MVPRGGMGLIPDFKGLLKGGTPNISTQLLGFLARLSHRNTAACPPPRRRKEWYFPSEKIRFRVVSNGARRLARRPGLRPVPSLKRRRLTVPPPGHSVGTEARSRPWATTRATTKYATTSRACAPSGRPSGTRCKRPIRWRCGLALGHRVRALTINPDTVEADITYVGNGWMSGPCVDIE